MQYNLREKHTPYKDQVLQYINIQNKPFNIKMVASETNIELATIRCYLAELLHKGTILKIKSKGRYATYIRNRNIKPKRRYTTRIPGNIYKEDVIKFIDTLQHFKLADIQKGLNCTYPQARRHILQLQKEKKVKAVAQDGHVWIYSTNLRESKSKITKIKQAAKKLMRDKVLITKKNLLAYSDLSLSTVKEAIQILIEDNFLELDYIRDHEKIYKINNHTLGTPSSLKAKREKGEEEDDSQ